MQEARVMTNEILEQYTAVRGAESMEKLMKNPNMTPEKRQQAKVMMDEAWEAYLGPDFERTVTMEYHLLIMQRLLDEGLVEEIAVPYHTRVFYCIDLDGDERISPREFEIYENAVGGSERAFRAIDTNGNGEITLEEYVTAYVRYATDTTVTVEELPQVDHVVQL